MSNSYIGPRYIHIEDSSQGYFEEWVEDTEDPESYLDPKSCTKLLNAKEDEIEQLRARLASMEEEVAFLRCLEAAGVDGWEGYEDAQRMFTEEGGEG